MSQKQNYVSLGDWRLLADGMRKVSKTLNYLMVSANVLKVSNVVSCIFRNCWKLLLNGAEAYGLLTMGELMDNNREGLPLYRDDFQSLSLCLMRLEVQLLWTKLNWKKSTTFFRCNPSKPHTEELMEREWSHGRTIRLTFSRKSILNMETVAFANYAHNILSLLKALLLVQIDRGMEQRWTLRTNSSSMRHYQWEEDIPLIDLRSGTDRTTDEITDELIKEEKRAFRAWENTKYRGLVGLEWLVLGEFVDKNDLLDSESEMEQEEDTESDASGEVNMEATVWWTKSSDSVWGGVENTPICTSTTQIPPFTHFENLTSSYLYKAPQSPHALKIPKI